MIKLSNGHCLEYVTASGAMGYDGQGWPWEKPLVWARLIQPELFTHITKTITALPHKGNVRWWNPFYCVRLLRGGVVNAVGLENPGLGWWFRHVGYKLCREKTALVASVYFESEPQRQEIAALLNAVDLVGVEVNTRCPNIQRSPYWQCCETIVRNCREFKKDLRHPLLLKLSVEDNVEQILPRLEGVVEAVSVNSVRWKKIFPDKPSPLAHLGGGGASGKITQSLVWPFLGRVARASAIPVIASAVWDFEDLARVRQYEVSAIGFGAVHLLYPWRPTIFVKKEMKRK